MHLSIEKSPLRSFYETLSDILSVRAHLFDKRLLSCPSSASRVLLLPPVRGVCNLSFAGGHRPPHVLLSQLQQESQLDLLLSGQSRLMGNPLQLTKNLALLTTS